MIQPTLSARVRTLTAVSCRVTDLTPLPIRARRPPVVEAQPNTQFVDEADTLARKQNNAGIGADARHGPR